LSNKAATWPNWDVWFSPGVGDLDADMKIGQYVRKRSEPLQVRRQRPRDTVRVEDNMDFFEVVKQRRSIRTFKVQAVEEEKLRAILEAVNQAPSAGNLQAYEVYVVRDAGRRTALVNATLGQGFMAEAQVVLVFCTHSKRAEIQYGQRGAELYTLQDATIACTYAMLATAALGLATVWVGKFDEALVREIAGVPAGQQPAAMLPIGYAGESPPAPTRRALRELVHEVV
jgi:nitroreductase